MQKTSKKLALIYRYFDIITIKKIAPTEL